jgi:peptidoglycan/xylan/chitin deacetylase (PgdA/CDA1 family)
VTGSAHSRRRFLATLATATVAGVGLARYTLDGGPRSAEPVPKVADFRVPVSPAVATAPQPPGLLPPPPPQARVALPGGGVLNALPGSGDLLALTVDDGVNTEVVRLYTQFAKDTGIRLTYFVNGVYPSWTDNLNLLCPLVASGQIQLGNHTWSHPDLTTLSASQVAQQITRNDRFLANTYGVDAKPFLRPPYGKHNAAVRAAAADLGYTATTMWNGSLSDSMVVTEEYIAAMAHKYFNPQAIVIGHLNHPPVTHVYDRLVDVIRARQLRTVTLNDVFEHPA